MAAPVATARATPSGIMLQNGHGSLITFAADTNIEFWELEVSPPGIDGGDPIEIVTHHSVTWRLMAPRTLKTLTPFDVVAGYDPALYTALLAGINREDTCTVEWPDGSTLAFYAFIQKVEYDALVEGELPQVTVTICPTNADPTTGAEEGPVFVNVAGT